MSFELKKDFTVPPFTTLQKWLQSFIFSQWQISSFLFIFHNPINKSHSKTHSKVNYISITKASKSSPKSNYPMNPIGYSLHTSSSVFPCFFPHKPITKNSRLSPNVNYPSFKEASKLPPKVNYPNLITPSACMAAAAVPQTADPRTFGINNLMETYSIEVHRAESRKLNVPLIAPFTIASSRLEKVENVAIRIELSNGCVGWGEAPILPFVTAEDQASALAKTGEVCEFLKQRNGLTLGLALSEIGGIVPGHKFASVRAGVEMALIDAVAHSIGVPLWRLFGGVSDTVTTDITIPIVSPTEASELALKYRKQGFKTLKLKVGKDLHTDIEVLQAIRAVHPDCLFILDANEGYTSQEAIHVLQKLHDMEVTPVLFEQPVHRDDWEGLGHVTRVAKGKFGVSVAADESCRGFDDANKIVEGKLADVINIKLAKVGVLGALEIIEFARKSGVSLMIGGMVETRLAMGFAGHLAAGLGCFKFVDLDTPLLLAEDPVFGGYEASGPVYKFANARGHGGFLHWNDIA